MSAAKKGIAASGETKAAAEGDLSVTTKSLAADTEALSNLHRDCMTKASDFEASMKSIKEELAALSAAAKIIQEQTGGASDLTYGLTQVSFLQQRSSSQAASGYTVVRSLRDLSRKSQ